MIVAEGEGGRKGRRGGRCGEGGEAAHYPCVQAAIPLSLERGQASPRARTRVGGPPGVGRSAEEEGGATREAIGYSDCGVAIETTPLEE